MIDYWETMDLAEIEKEFASINRVYLGGSGEMYMCKTHLGKEYIFKVSKHKVTNYPQPFRAYVQEAGYKVQKIVDPKSAIACKAAKINGKFGTIQEKINTVGFRYDFHDQNITSQLLREFVTDYLLSNYDTKNDNFIMGEDGILRGCDKEQSFRYMLESKPNMSEDYRPDVSPPIYNWLFQQYRIGEANIDFDQIWQYVDRVEAVSEEDYKKIFIDYVNNVPYPPKSREVLLEKIMERKRDIRQHTESFINHLNNERQKNGISDEKGIKF